MDTTAACKTNFFGSLDMGRWAEIRPLVNNLVRNGGPAGR